VVRLWRSLDTGSSTTSHIIYIHLSLSLSLSELIIELRVICLYVGSRSGLLAGGPDLPGIRGHLQVPSSM